MLEAEKDLEVFAKLFSLYCFEIAIIILTWRSFQRSSRYNHSINDGKKRLTVARVDRVPVPSSNETCDDFSTKLQLLKQNIASYKTKASKTIIFLSKRI